MYLKHKEALEKAKNLIQSYQTATENILYKNYSKERYDQISKDCDEAMEEIADILRSEDFIPNCKNNTCKECYSCYQDYVSAKMTGELD